MVTDGNWNCKSNSVCTKLFSVTFFIQQNNGSKEKEIVFVDSIQNQC